MTTTTHKRANGTILTYTKEQKALDFAALVFNGMTKKEAMEFIKARYK